MANPNTPSFPYAAPIDAVLTVASDNAQTTLSNDILGSDVIIPVVNAGSFIVPCLLVIDGEVILAKNKSSNSFTSCVRGFSGTTAVSHSNTTGVFGYVLSYHHNQLAAEVSSLGNFLTVDNIGGLRLHENLVSYSEAFESWALTSGSTITATTGLAPNTSNTARTLLDGTTSGTNGASILPNSLSVGLYYTFSIYAKYTNNQWLAVGQNIANDSTRFVSFDLINGIIGVQGANAIGSIVPVGGGWFRLLVELTCTSASGKTFDVVLETVDGTVSYIGGATQTVVLWGGQVHTGKLSGPIPYIRTSGSMVSFTGGGDLILDGGTLSGGIDTLTRRGTTSDHSSYTGKPGQVTVDTTLNTVRVHDGSTTGGWPLAAQIHTHSIATDSVAGFLSASDKTKLDSISGGTINYQTLQANGTGQLQRGIINLSANFSLTDDSAGNRTSVDLSDSGVSSGTWTKVTVNSKGRITVGAVLSAGDIPALTSTKITDFGSTVVATKLNQFATPNADINLGNNKIINLTDPISASDAATKNYVDNAAVGLTFKQACRAASSGSNINLSAPGTTIDTVSLNNGDRILVKDQSDATTNGIYIFNGASSVMTRSIDTNTSAEVKSGMFVLINEGSVNAEAAFVLATTGVITLGATNLNFVQFSAGGGAVVAGNGISVSGSTVSVKPVSTSRITVGSSGVDLATSGATAGTYNQVTVDVYGRITSATSQSYQPSSANLSGVTSISTTGFISRTGSGTFATRAIQSGYGTAVTNGDGIAGNTTVAVTDDSSLQQVKASLAGSVIAQRSNINFIEAGTATITVVDNPSNNRVDVTINGSGGGGGSFAPLTDQYLILSNDSALVDARTVAIGTGITAVDGGAGSTYTVSMTTNWGAVPSPTNAVPVQHRSGTTGNHSSFAGLLGEITVDTTKKTLVVHDGSTLGGTPLALQIHTHTASQISGLTYQTIQLSGTSQTTRPILNLTSLFTASDDAINNRTTVSLANNNTSGAGTYGSTTQVAQVTINAQGLVTAVSQLTIAGVIPAGTASGDLGGTYPGPSVASVGGQTAANVATATNAYSNSTAANTPSTLVIRDSSGNFAANVITASLVGNVTGNCSGTSAAFTGNLSGDVNSTGMVTALVGTAVTPATYGSATQVARFTVDSKGRLTNASNVTISGVAPAGGAGGDLSGSFPSPTVATVGGLGATNVATGAQAALDAVPTNTFSEIISRDGGGNFAATGMVFGTNTVSFSATPTFDTTLGTVQKIVLTNSVTSSTMTGLTASQFVVFDIVQGGGSYTFAWPANVFGGSVIGNVNGKHNVQIFYSDGSNLYALSAMRTDLG